MVVERVHLKGKFGRFRHGPATVYRHQQDTAEAFRTATGTLKNREGLKDRLESGDLPVLTSLSDPRDAGEVVRRAAYGMSETDLILSILLELALR